MYVFIWEQNKTDEKQLDEHVVFKTYIIKEKKKIQIPTLHLTYGISSLWALFFFFFFKAIKFQSDFAGDLASRITSCKMISLPYASEMWGEAPM